MTHRLFSQIWDQLRGKKPQLPSFLEEVTIKNFRGISDLRVTFNFPVCVIAGANGSGKSTVLFTCASAYKITGANPKLYAPSSLFPNLKSDHHTSLNDKKEQTRFEYYYVHNGKRSSMVWSRGKSWNKSFMGKKQGAQPERSLYLRTLANLTNPSEVRSVLTIGKGNTTTQEITSDLLSFAQRILPQRYKSISSLTKGDRDLLVANREDDSSHYSEFHMSAGERAILRISKDISKLRNALVLIDEIEAGLHPFTQQQIMLELQRLALRNELQIIVTSHSPVILDSVPPEGRIFLERIGNNVFAQPPHRDIIQKAFYGQSIEKLSILCEDEIAEAIILGVLDNLNPKLLLTPEDISVGRDTGKDQFVQHIDALSKFKKLDDFLFVLDGDGRDLDAKLKLAAEDRGSRITPIYLPGDQPPEVWLWKLLTEKYTDFAPVLGLNEKSLYDYLTKIEQLYLSAADKPANIAKNKFNSLSELTQMTESEIIRKTIYHESKKEEGDLKIFMNDLQNELNRWRSRA